MDINMPKLNGIETTKFITDNYPKTKVIAFTLHNESYIAKEMLEAGVKGYLLKNTDITEITKAILTVNNGGIYICKEVEPIIRNNKTLKKLFNKNKPRKK